MNINYIEIPTKDLNSSKQFFRHVFDWGFIDYGPEYSSFTNAGIDGGFFKSNLTVSTKSGSILVVLLSNDLQATLTKVTKFGGEIIKPIFSFPGGKRFHFTDPSQNEFAVWTKD